jgi:ferredoxin
MGTSVVAVFSGTGNALRAASILAQELRDSGHSVETADLAAGASLPALGAGDTLVLCTSTLGFSPPSTVMRILKTAPRSPGARAAALFVCGGIMSRGKISGGWSGAASLVALALLRRRGYESLGSADASYPENWTQVTEAAMGADQEAILARGDAEARAFGKAVAAGRPGFVRRNLLTKSLGRFVGFIFRLTARRFLAKLFIADERCTSCGLCARRCPASAIAMVEGLPSWKDSCCACNRCINICPVTAIQSSTARLVLFVALNLIAVFAASPAARALLAFIDPSFPAPIQGFVAFVSSLALFAAFCAFQLGPLDRLLRAMERRPALRRFFTASFTRGYRRYVAPGFKSE